jgi:hypothetical protein
MSQETPPPRKTTKLAFYVVAIIGLMIAAIFVGFNIHHADTQRERQSGEVEPRDAPRTPTDLQRPPVRQ